MRNEPFRRALADSVVPTHLQQRLRRWVEEGIRPGGFLSAVLANDLMAAASRGDELSLVGLPVLCRFLREHAPEGSFGSPRVVENWPDFIIAQNRRDQRAAEEDVTRIIRELTPRDFK